MSMFSNYKQTRNTHYNVVKMMRMTWSSFMQVFIKRLTEDDMEYLSPWWNEKGAMATIPKMMPRQHIGSGSSWRYRFKRKCADVRNMLEMVGCSRLPGSHGSVAWKRVTNRTRCKQCISYNTCIPSTAVVSSLYLWSVRFRGGTSSMRCRRK